MAAVMHLFRCLQRFESLQFYGGFFSWGTWFCRLCGTLTFHICCGYNRCNKKRLEDVNFVWKPKIKHFILRWSCSSLEKKNAFHVPHSQSSRLSRKLRLTNYHCTYISLTAGQTSITPINCNVNNTCMCKWHSLPMNVADALRKVLSFSFSFSDWPVPLCGCSVALSA